MQIFNPNTMKTPIQIIANAKKELNQNDFCDWLEESLVTFKELEKNHISKAYVMGSLDRLTDRAALTSEEYYNQNYNE
jgi:hypothetical protein